MSSGKPLILLGAVSDYLHCSDVVDFDAPSVAVLGEAVAGGDHISGRDDVAVLRRAFELVRDRFPHSFDAAAGTAGAETGVACSASDVVRLGHGFCYAKSHLLAALLRYNGIPAGFCYQRMNTADYGFILHGFNAVCLGDRWVRVDARGNNECVRVEFDPARDMLAYPADEAMGERIYPFAFTRPDAGVIRALRAAAGRRPRDFVMPAGLSCPLDDGR